MCARTSDRVRQFSVSFNRRTTPNLERLAAEGAVFEHAYSNATWTLPSTSSFMTSLYTSAGDEAPPLDILEPGKVGIACIAIVEVQWAISDATGNTACVPYFMQAMVYAILRRVFLISEQRVCDQGGNMVTTSGNVQSNQDIDGRPVYEAPKITTMDSDEVLQAFQMTAAQISAAGCWWTPLCAASPCSGGG